MFDPIVKPAIIFRLFSSNLLMTLVGFFFFKTEDNTSPVVDEDAYGLYVTDCRPMA